jgi:signal transduction histidine kinase
MEDGLPSDFVTTALRDRSNTLWFGTTDGVARMTPEPPTATSPAPPIFLGDVQVAGVPYLLSPLGEQSVGYTVLRPDQTSLRVRYFSVGREVGNVIRYRYRLLGAQEDWSNPIQERNVQFENLSPGDYEFQVQAVGSDGNMSATPARMTFTILAPVTLRWWFKTLVAFIAVVAGYAAYRYRISTLLRLERLRLSIASDLHDEVGSALTKISIHSEIIQNATDANKVHSSSRMIGSLSREVIRTFSDIVWSIDTRHDTYGELTARMKSFALDVLSPKDINVEFSFHGLDPSAKVPVELRQNLYLIFKESVNNVVRHSSATKVSIGLQRMDHTLRLSVQDNGHGIPPGRTDAGHGLKNMKMRAALLQGSLEIEHQNGCAITLTVKIV